MKTVEINPNTLRGTINIPPSKSMSHRAIICASLAKGVSTIHNVAYSKDIIATLEGMKSLGAKVVKEEKDRHNNYSITIEGVKNFKLLNNFINANESGSTIRFLIPILMLANEEYTITGEGRLKERPLDTFYNIFKKQGIEYKNENGKLPLTVIGSLKPDIFEIEGDISSQFISGLLFTLPLLGKDSKIVITKSELESKGYIDLTIQMLKRFSIKIVNNDYKEFIIEGNQKYISTEYTVEGDYSQGAFWIVAGLIGDEIVSNNLSIDSLQGDKEVVDIVKRMKGDITIEKRSIVTKNSETCSTVIDASQCPDIIPVLSVLASLSVGKTEIINGKRLRIKESDRITSTRTELSKLGADIVETEEGLIINGKNYLDGGVEISSWNDHRIAMAMAIASIRCKEKITITGSESVSKSYPNFWEDFKMLGGTINEWSVGR